MKILTAFAAIALLSLSISAQAKRGSASSDYPAVEYDLTWNIVATHSDVRP
ncbi:hypothetical protein [Allopusillimonas soli]|uniref:Uncharacterized protein n=1 Tax=Allopusillimonas soli TaxID=659016 RepID=A0A853FGJ4_9BURK|nr:hypothetical protein [Allopusillimonas soli]NYT38989.1 hypothetical protein [Allopusillimonas soli]